MKFERRLTPKAKVDMTPLVDVLFMLLLFFMMTSVFRVMPGLTLNLPVSTTKQSVPMTQITVTAVSATEIYVNKVKTDVAGLDQAVKLEMGSKAPTDIRAVFQGDKDVPYQLVVTVLDSFKKNGIDGVNLVTRAAGARP